MSERISLSEAARQMGISPQCLRIQMQRGLVDIGYVAKSTTGNSYRYYIFREKLNKVIGK